MHVELHLDNNQIHLVLSGEGQGELYFRDFSEFSAFIEKCYDFVEGYQIFIEAYAALVATETPIPEVFREAFDN